MDLSFKQEYEQIQAVKLAREAHTAVCHPLGYIDIRGRRVLNLSSFDYLDLCNNPRVKRAAIAELEASGVGVSSPRLASGWREAHAAAEFRLASFFGSETALLLSSRTQATLSLFSNLLTERDAVLFDESAQSAVADAAYLVNAQVFNFRTEDPHSLAIELERARGARRRIVLVEALSAFSGQACNIRKILDISTRGAATLVIDETLAVGALGLRGAGLSEGLPSREGILAIVCDLSFGLCGFGAVIATSKAARGLVVSRSRTLSTEAPIPSHLASAVESSLNAVELSPVERAAVLQRAERLRYGLRELGLLREVDFPSPIVAVPFEKRSLAHEFAEALFQRGFLGELVPRGTTLSESVGVRFVMRSVIQDAAVEGLLQAVSDIRSRIPA